MQQHAAAFKVLQEANTEACAFRCTFDKPRNIGDNEALLVIHTHNAKARHQRGKRIIGHFRLRRRNGANEGRFTGIRHTQHPDVCQQHQLQLQIALVARCPHRFLTRSTVDGRFETGVAQTVPAAFSDHQTLTMLSHIAHDFAGALIDNTGPYRHFDRHVFTTFTGTVATLAILSTLSAEGFFKTVIDQGVQVFVRFQPDITTITTVAAVRAASRDIFFTAEANATIAAITCYDQDCCFINKLHFTLRKSFA